MIETKTTFSSLAKDFDLTKDAVIRLAIDAGIPDTHSDRALNDDEISRLYDAWLLSLIPHPKKHEDHSTGREHLIIIDTSSLLHDGAEPYLNRITPILIRNGRKIIVPMAVMDELNAKAIQSSNPELSRKARHIIDVVLSIRDMGAAAIYGDDNDGTFADNVFHKAVAMFALKYNLTVITQDYRLGQDLLAMGHMRSVNRRHINVSKLNKSGHTVPIKWEGVKN